MKKLSQFTNLYPVSKTLRFELIPQGKTLEHIQKHGIINDDIARANSYAKMKKTIDAYHQAFIRQALSGVKLNGLDEFASLYCASTEKKTDEKWRKAYDVCRQNLRKEISKRFESDPLYNNLSKKELIREDLKPWIDENELDLYYDESFSQFTTYFVGYNQNRMNMYSDEEKATAISHRMIDENLPKHMDNIGVYHQLKKSPVFLCFAEVEDEMREWLGDENLDEVFSVPHFNELLTQSQIDKYNTIIGGISEDHHKIKGINEYVNLYNQTHKDARLPGMKMLVKQILSDRQSTSWLPEAFHSAKEVIEAVAEFAEGFSASMESLKSILDELSHYNNQGIYVRKDALGEISSNLYGSYHIIQDAMEEERTSDYYSLQKLQERIDIYMSDADFHAATGTKAGARRLNVYFADRLGEINENLSLAHEKVSMLLYNTKDGDNAMKQEEKDILKEYMDTVLQAVHLVRPFYLPSDSNLEKDDAFYGLFAPCYETELKPAAKLYDMVRNYATQKPYSTEKVKLNFGSSQLLGGWDVNKEKDCLGVLFVRNGLYYLGIMDKSHNHIFEETPECTDKNAYFKVQYKLLPGPNKMLPKVFFSKSRIAEFAPDENILRIYRDKTFKSGDAFSLNDCHALIDFYKASITKHPEWKSFGFRFSPTESYQNINAFFEEVADQGYALSFKSISEEYIDKLVNEGELYLFQIYNKDFSPKSTGKKNLHTLYWEELFAERNLKDVVYKLNGQAEVFYRMRSIEPEKAVVHAAGIPIAKKNPALSGQRSIFAYNITKDRRYTVDKFQFHVPITMNFKAPGKPGMNDRVCEYIRNTPDIHILGIDRGERHLLYLSLIDRYGRVVQDENGRDIQYSLNTLSGEYRNSAGEKVQFSTPYRELLDQKEKERAQARENWDTIENIKELKTGYLSQVVHHIAKLMVKYNAVVVLEDLNTGFKRGRFKVEKQVYQNFEKALIDKLNYLVFKDADPAEPGGLCNALQLTDAFSSFQNLRKQTGFLFYVQAWNTSKIDPVTGFVDLLKPKYKNMADAKALFRTFRGIRYDAERDWFEFEFDYKDFGIKNAGVKTRWTVCTHGDVRYTYQKEANGGRGGTVRWNVTEKLKELFDRYGIDCHAGDLREEICCQEAAPFFASLIKNLQVTLALRYSSAEDGADFILSPVMDKDGRFFSSEDGIHGLPQDADANGAYNIARKGLMLLHRIDEAGPGGKWHAAIGNDEWLSFVQSQR